MKAARTSTVTSLALAAALVACGDERLPIDARLGVPEPREARVNLSPALDVTSLIDPSLADRISIDEIVVNVSEVRLLGTDPRLPSGGYPLVTSERQLSTLDEGDAGRFPFPAWMLDDDLAIYVRIGGSEALDGASVVVRARLFEEPRSATVHSLRASMEAPNPDGEPARGGSEAPNPDGEPARGGGSGAPNPDGEPANGGGTGAPNPDGEPAECDPTELAGCVRDGTLRRGLSYELPESRWIEFELRGKDIADLVVGFDRSSRLNVVLGIPAARWFTPDVVETLESALLEQLPGEAATAEKAPERKLVVVEPECEPHLGSKPAEDRLRSDGKRDGDDYRLVDDDAVDPNLRRR